MKKSAAFIIIAVLALAAGCGAAQPPAEWDKMIIAYRGKGGELMGAAVKAAEGRPLGFGTFVKYFLADAEVIWSADDRGNWTAQAVKFNKKKNTDQAMVLRFYKTPANDKVDVVLLAEMSMDGKSMDMFIKQMIKMTAEKVSEDLAK